MADSRGHKQPTPTGSGKDEVRGKRPYAAPRLEPLGNLRLVLGKSGALGDMSMANPRRP